MLQGKVIHSGAGWRIFDETVYGDASEPLYRFPEYRFVVEIAGEPPFTVNEYIVVYEGIAALARVELTDAHGNRRQLWRAVAHDVSPVLF